MRRRIACFLAAFSLIVTGLAIPARAKAEGAVRFSSSGITWDITGELSLDGTLTISGTGGIPDSFGTGGAMGQALGAQKSQVKKIVIEDGITAIGSGAFYSYGALEEIIIPASVRGMDESCFNNCYKLTSVRFLGELPHDRLYGELYINGDVTVYCPREYFAQYRYLMTYWRNRAETSSGHVRPVRLCTSDTPVQAELSQTAVILSAQEPTVRLTASINGEEVSSGVRWSSADTDIAAVDGSGRVTVGQRHGSTLICAEVPFGDGDMALVTCQVYATRNGSLVDCLPVSGLEADAPVTCNTTIISWDGVMSGYKPAKFIEQDTENPYYQEIAQLTDGLTQSCRTETEKARAIQRWVSENVEYGGMLAIGDQVGQVYAVYEARSAHCQGYSYLTGFMLYLAGIPSAIAVSIDHMWNLALLDGRWVMIDSTWGDFDFDYDDPDHGYITYIALGQGDCCLIVDDDSGVKLAGVGLHELERDGLTAITVPDGVSTLCGYSIAYCKDLTAVYLPQSIAAIGESVFLQDGKLTDIFYAGTREQWDAVEKSDDFAGYQAGVTVHTMDPVAHPSAQTVAIDGKKTQFQMYALKDANGNPTNYIKVRDLALALKGTQAQFAVEWSAKDGVNLVAGGSYVPNGSENATPFSGERPYKLPDNPTGVNGAASSLQAIVLTDDSGGDYTYYKLRDLGEALGFNVGYSDSRGVFIETGMPYTDAD